MLKKDQMKQQKVFFSHFLKQFFHNVRDPVKLYLLQDPIQITKTDFSENFSIVILQESVQSNGIKFNKITNLNNLTETSVQKLLNQLFWLDKDRTENIMSYYVDENNTNFSQNKCTF